MKHIVIIRTGIVLLALFILSCGQNKSNRNEAYVEQTELKMTQGDTGELAYKKHCMTCHQRDGGGIPNMYPPLAKNKVVSGDKDELITIVLNGLSGEIKVNGKKYNGVMASYRNLSDAEIAGVLSYLRSNFGNEGEKVTPDEVKALR